MRTLILATCLLALSGCAYRVVRKDALDRAYQMGQIAQSIDDLGTIIKNRNECDERWMPIVERAEQALEQARQDFRAIQQILKGKGETK